MKIASAKKRKGRFAGRPREFNEEIVLLAAAQAFWQRGYHATSIDDLCKATGLLRGSLYGAYGDKRGIFLAALKFYCEARVTRLNNSISLGKGGRENVRQGLLYYIEAASDLDLARACFITNTALELVPQDQEVAAVIEDTFMRMSSIWTRAVRRAQYVGELKGKFDPNTAGHFLFCIVQGLRVLGKIYDPDELGAVVDFALRALEEE